MPASGVPSYRHWGARRSCFRSSTDPNRIDRNRREAESRAAQDSKLRTCPRAGSLPSVETFEPRVRQSRIGTGSSGMQSSQPSPHSVIPKWHAPESRPRLRVADQYHLSEVHVARFGERQGRRPRNRGQNREPRKLACGSGRSRPRKDSASSLPARARRLENPPTAGCRSRARRPDIGHGYDVPHHDTHRRRDLRQAGETG
jgi:hypothetical protein